MRVFVVKQGNIAALQFKCQAPVARYVNRPPALALTDVLVGAPTTGQGQNVAFTGNRVQRIQSDTQSAGVVWLDAGFAALGPEG